MNLKKCLLTKNNCYKMGTKMKVKGIMVHSTGANNPYLKRYIQPNDGLLGENKNGNHWNNPRPDGRDVCVHAFIGRLNDGTIATYQTLPFDMRGWHCGGAANNGYIGFEICEDNLCDSGYFWNVYYEAVDFCAYLCKLYGLTEKNIICHAEGYQLGMASNHSDVLHWFKRFGANMNDFRYAVSKKLNGNIEEDEDDMQYYEKLEEVPEYAYNTIKKLIDKKFLFGDGKGNYHLSEQNLQMYVVNDRAGLYGK